MATRAEISLDDHPVIDGLSVPINPAVRVGDAARER